MRHPRVKSAAPPAYPLPQQPRMMGGGDHRTKGTATMGDKSPKAAKKQASQKQAKSDRAEQKKRQEVAAKQVPRK